MARLPGAVPGGPRPASPRGVALVALALSAVGLAVLVHEGAERRALSIRFRPPFAAGSAEAETPGGRPWSAATVRRPTVLLYVAWSCSHCAVELARWADLLDAEGSVPPVDVRVVAPGPPPRGLLPARLEEGLLLDPEAATARALGARVVPTTAYVAPGGTVVALTRGRSTPGGVRHALERLREASGRAAAP